MAYKLILALCCLAIASKAVNCDVLEWNYDPSGDHGPEDWQEGYPHCGGDEQSPINIVEADADPVDDLHDFEFDHYDETSGVTMTIMNNGHSAELHVAGTTMTLSGGDLGHDYIFEQMQFHWGTVDTQGSEHTFNGEHYPMEMHLVHYHSSYDDVEDAKTHEDGIAVLAFFFELSDEDDHDLDNIIDGIDHIPEEGNTTEITTFSLMSLIASHTDEYYRYHGSLTTPGCEENVIWSVFTDHITISHAQLEHFRAMHDHDGNDMQDNFRPVQDLHGRVVKHHVHHDDDDNAAGTMAVSMALTVATMFAVLLQ